MNLLHRYLFLSVLYTAVFAVSLFVFVLVTGNAIRDIISLIAQGYLTGSMVAKFILLLIPYVVAYALPLGLVTAILIVLGRLSAQREIVAMKAAGLSLYQISAPIFAIAFIGAALATMINFYYAPVAKLTYRHSLANIIRDNPLQFIVPKTFIHDFPGHVLYVGEREGAQLRDFWVWQFEDSHQVTVFLRAEQGNFSYDPSDDSLVLTLLHGSGEKRRRADPEDLADPTLPTLSFDELAIRVPLREIIDQNTFTKKLSMHTFGELLTLRQELLQQEAAGDTRAWSERIKVQLQIQKNFALAFAIFSLALIAIPLGIKASRTETYANITLALGLAMLYYLLVVALSWFEKRPQWRPDLLIWLPNITFQIVGIWLLRRANAN